MIRNAQLNDLDRIMDIVAVAKREMKAENRAQWNENYPLDADFAADIAGGTLYVNTTDGQLNGFICVNAIEPVEYQSVPWSLREKALVIHRMAVDGNLRQRGIGSLLMKFAEDLARQEDIHYLKSDTYSLNPYMNALFRKLNYDFKGEIFFPGREKAFYCYEKILG